MPWNQVVRYHKSNIGRAQLIFFLNSLFFCSEREPPYVHAFDTRYHYVCPGEAGHYQLIQHSMLTGMGVGVPMGEGVSFEQRGAVYFVFHRTFRAPTPINRFLGGPWSQKGSSRRPRLAPLKFYRALGSIVPQLADFHPNVLTHHALTLSATEADNKYMS